MLVLNPESGFVAPACHTLFTIRRRRSRNNRLMGTARSLAGIAVILGLAVFIAVWLAVESRAQAPETSNLAGVWTLNHEASDKPPAPGDRDDPNGRGRRGGFGRGGGGGGGMGHGGYRGGAGGGGQRGGSRDPEAMARMRDALRDIFSPPERLTITQTGTMILLTGPDGRTTRLAADGSKVKDENTNIERKTKWDGGRLISEIGGLPQGKVTQTFALDPEHHQLKITAHAEGGRMGQARTLTSVYDSDAR